MRTSEKEREMKKEYERKNFNDSNNSFFMHF